MSGTVADNIDRQSGVIAEAAGGAEVRSDDPSASAGTVWFNTTSGTLKVYRSITGWSTKNALLTAVKQLGGAGTTAAGLSFGGNSGSRTTETEEFELDPISKRAIGEPQLEFAEGGIVPRVAYRDGSNWLDKLSDDDGYNL